MIEVWLGSVHYTLDRPVLCQVLTIASYFREVTSDSRAEIQTTKKKDLHFRKVKSTDTSYLPQIDLRYILNIVIHQTQLCTRQLYTRQLYTRLSYILVTRHNYIPDTVIYQT